MPRDERGDEQRDEQRDELGAAGAPAVLAIDASTYHGSVAVLRGGRVLAERVAAMRGADEERLMPAVAAALDAAGVTAATLGAVVCGGGPGSFTSLRIAGAIAKGIATATDCPLLAAPSLALAAAVSPPGPARPHGRQGGERVLVTLDAMRGERYAALVTVGAPVAGPGTPAAVLGYEYLGVHPADAVNELARRHAADRVLDAGEHPPHAAGVAGFALAVPGWPPAGVGRPALAPVALALWEPDYGRKAEAQVKWEVAHGRALPADPTGAVLGSGDDAGDAAPVGAADAGRLEGAA